MRTITSLLLATILWSSLLVSGPGIADAQSADPPEVQCDGETRKGSNEFFGRIEYAITYNRSTQRVCAIAKNIGERNRSFGYTIVTDDFRVLERGSIELEPGERFRNRQNITNVIDATKDNHSIRVSTYNKTYHFNFTRKINTMNEGGIPTPHLENLTIKRNGTTSGQPRIDVEVENEGARTYVPEAEVRTLESDTRSLGGDYSVRLSEDNDDVIVGTVRLYGGTFNPDTKFDRVSFVSYPNGTYETWEPEFGEVPTNREIERGGIYYENESAREEYGGPDVDPISEEASKVGAVAVVAIVVGLVWYRRRGS